MIGNEVGEIISYRFSNFALEKYNYYNGHSKAIKSILFFKNDDKIISVSQDGYVFLWDFKSSKILRSFNITKSGVNDTLLWKENLLFVISPNEGFFAFDISSSKIIFEFKIDLKLERLFFNPRNDKIFTYEGSNLQIWCPISLKLEAKKEFEEDITAIAFHPDSNDLAIAFDDHSIHILSNEYTIIKKLEGHHSIITSLLFTFDGKKIFSASEDKTLKIWLCSIGSEIKSINLGNNKVVKMLLNKKNDKMIISTSDKSLKIFETSNKYDLQKFSCHKDAVLSLAISFDGSLLASFSEDGNLKIWNSTNGEEIAQYTPSFFISKMGFFQNHEKLIIYNSNKKVEVFEVATSKTSTLEFSYENVLFTSNESLFLGIQKNNWYYIHKDEIEREEGDLLFESSSNHCLNYDGTSLAYFYDGKVFLKEISLKGEGISINVSEFQIKFLCFSSDSSMIGCVNMENTVKIYDAYRKIQIANFNNNNIDIKLMVFHPTSHNQFICVKHKEVIIYELFPMNLVAKLEEHSLEINSLVFNSEGNRFYTASNDKTIKFWDWFQRKDIKTLSGHTKPITAIISTINKIITASEDHSLIVWDSFHMNELKRIKEHTDIITSLSQTQKKFLFASGSYDRKVKIWDTNKLECLKTIEFSRSVNILQFNNQGSYLAVGLTNGFLKIFDTNLFEEVISIESPHDSIFTIHYSPDGERIVSGGESNGIVIWDARTGTKLFKNEESGRINALIYDREGNKIIGGDNLGYILVFSAKNGRKIRMIKAHSGAINDLFLNSEDHDSVITASNDETVRFWNLNSGEENYMKCIQEKNNGFNVISLKNDENLMIGGGEGDLYLCNIQMDMDAVTFLANFVLNKSINSQAVLDLNVDLSLDYFSYENTSFSFLHALFYTKQYHRIFYFLEEYQKNKELFKYFPVDNLGNTVIKLLTDKRKMFNDMQLKEILKFYTTGFIEIGYFYEQPSFFENLLRIKSFVDVTLDIFESRFLTPPIICEFSTPWKYENNYQSLDFDFEINNFFISDEDINNSTSTFLKFKRIIKNWWFEFKLKKSGNQVYKSFYPLRILDIPEMTKISPSSTRILEIISNMDIQSDYFKHPALCALINFKWKRYGQTFNFSDFLTFLLFLGLTTVFYIFLLPAFDSGDRKDVIDYMFIIGCFLILIFDIYFIYMELKQLKRLGFNRYRSNFWNYLDWVVLLMVMAACIVDICIYFDGYVIATDNNRALHSLTLLAIWLRLIDYFRGFKWTVVYVVMISQVLRDIKVFIFLLFIIVSAFVLSASVIVNTDKIQLIDLFRSFYRLILGDFDKFDEYYDENESQSIDVLYFFFFLSTLLLLIILLNLLIGIISDSYQKIMAGMKCSIMHERVNLLVDIEKMMSPKEIEKINSKLKKYLLVVFKKEPQSRFDDEIDVVDIRFKGMAEKMHYELQNNKVEISVRINALESKLDLILTKLNSGSIQNNRNSVLMESLKKRIVDIVADNKN